MSSELEKYVMPGPSKEEASAFFVGLKKQAKAPEPEEMAKEARFRPTFGQAAALSLGAAAGLPTGVYLGMGSKNRKQMSKEIRDPRLYSNLRGMASFESAKERVKAHKKLKRGKHTVTSAMREGFTRGKTKKAESESPIRQAQLATARRVLETRVKDRPGTVRRTATGAGAGAAGGALGGAGLAAGLSAITSALTKGKVKIPTRAGMVAGTIGGAATGGYAGQMSARKKVQKYKGRTAQMAISSAQAVPLAIRRTLMTGQPSTIAIRHKGKVIPVFAVGKRGEGQEKRSQAEELRKAAAFAVMAEFSKMAEEEEVESLDSDVTPPTPPEVPASEEYLANEVAGQEAEASNAIEYYQQQLAQARQELGMAQEQAQQAQATADQLQQTQAGHSAQLQAAQQEAAIAEQAAVQNVQAAGQRATEAMNQALGAEERALQSKQESTQAQLAVQGMRGQLLDLAAQDPGLPGATPPPEAAVPIEPSPQAPPVAGGPAPPQPGAEAPTAGLNQEGMPAQQEPAQPEGPPAAAGPGALPAGGAPEQKSDSQPSSPGEKSTAKPSSKVDIKVSHALGKA